MTPGLEDLTALTDSISSFSSASHNETQTRAREPTPDGQLLPEMADTMGYDSEGSVTPTATVARLIKSERVPSTPPVQRVARKAGGQAIVISETPTQPLLIQNSTAMPVTTAEDIQLIRECQEAMEHKEFMGSDIDSDGSATPVATGREARNLGHPIKEERAYSTPPVQRVAQTTTGEAILIEESPSPSQIQATNKQAMRTIKKQIANHSLAQEHTHTTDTAQATQATQDNGGWHVARTM